MPVCGRELHIACMRSKSSSLKAEGCGPRARRLPIKCHTCSIRTYPGNKLPKEEVACVGLNRSLEQYLQHVGVHYPAERNILRSSLRGYEDEKSNDEEYNSKCGSSSEFRRRRHS
ncbi:uncharacterized protein TNCV_999401 [Trichonephila clavipes]|nr:uncharacterized protein TNCV_999401 [Trichonephila clavipes]